MINVTYGISFYPDESGLENLRFSSIIISWGDTVMIAANKSFLL